MQILLQTRYNAPKIVYDSEVPVEPGPGAFDFAKSFLQPVIQVKQGNLTVYSSGAFYEDKSTENIIRTLGLLFGIGLTAYRLLKR